MHHTPCLNEDEINARAAALAEAHYNDDDRVVVEWGMLTWANISSWNGGKEGERWKHAARTGEVPVFSRAACACPCKSSRQR